MKEINVSTILKVIIIVILAAIIFEVAKVLIDLLLFGIILYIVYNLYKNYEKKKNNRS